MAKKCQFGRKDRILWGETCVKGTRILIEYLLGGNDTWKNIFIDSFDSAVWQFVKKSDIVTYFYSGYKNVEELLLF